MSKKDKEAKSKKAERQESAPVLNKTSLRNVARGAKSGAGTMFCRECGGDKEGARINRGTCRSCDTRTGGPHPKDESGLTASARKNLARGATDGAGTYVCYQCGGAKEPERLNSGRCRSCDGLFGPERAVSVKIPRALHADLAELAGREPVEYLIEEVMGVYVEAAKQDQKKQGKKKKKKKGGKA